jgi:hypothetical protein
MFLTGYATTKAITTFVLTLMFFFNAWLLFSGTLRLNESCLRCEDERRTLLGALKSREDRKGVVRADPTSTVDYRPALAWDIKVNKAKARALGIRRETEGTRVFELLSKPRCK